MIARISVQTLVDIGFDEGDARTRAGLLWTAMGQHRQLTAGGPAWCWFVPGRVEVFGKHTDYAGGRSLVAAVPRGIAVAASPRADDTIRVGDAISHEIRAVRVAETDQAAPGWPKYVQTVVRRLAVNFPGAALGADIVIASDLPRAAGLSSSSALIVGVATALIRRGALRDRPEWRDTIEAPLDEAGYLGALERGAAYGSLAGTEALGVFGGSEDHTAILTCRAHTLSAYRYVPIQWVDDATMPEDWRFVIASSGAAAAKAGGARERYNAASLAGEALVARWNEATGETRNTLADILASNPDAAERLRRLAESNRGGAFEPEVLARRLAHFVAEDARVAPALAAFLDADKGALGDLSRASQSDAETLLQNQIAETSALARLAREHGGFAATSFGAGFGGSVWALAPAHEAPSFGDRWIAAYRAQFPDRQHVSWFAARPAPGLFECAVT